MSEARYYIDRLLDPAEQPQYECNVCGRPHSVYRDFGLCRICLRKMANEGLLPGVKKSSW